MNQFYVSWHTWHMEPVTTPWDFWYLSEGERYKPLRPDVPEFQQVWLQEAFTQGDAAQLDRINQDYVKDVKLMAFVAAPDATAVQKEVERLFPDAQFDRVEVVDSETQKAILTLIQSTLVKKQS
jgi:hypothetical protein